MTDDDEQQARFRERLLRRRIDHVAESGWWLRCPTHGRAPVDPYQPGRCAFCAVGYNPGDNR